MNIHVFERERRILGDLASGNTFKFVGKNNVYQVLSLDKGELFTQPDVVLREDVRYCSDIRCGAVSVHQKSLEVEVVDLNVFEVVGTNIITET